MNLMDTIVISLGGSIISQNDLNVGFMKSFSELIQQLDDRKKFAIVVGGGKTARNYISTLKKYGINDSVLDEIGIYATRMNALALSALFPESNKQIPVSIDEAAELLHTHKYVVMGGTVPGHTTDTVSALLAELTGSKILINATSVDGVYSDDPKANKDAKKFERLTYDDAIKLSVEKSIGAGPNVFMDITSLNIAKRSGIKIYVIDGFNLMEYGSIIKQGATSGSVIE